MYPTVKVKFIQEQATKSQRGSRWWLYSFFTSALDVMGGQRHAPGRFTPEKEQVTIVQEAGWVSGSVWTGAGNLALSNIRSPDRPSHSESLYRLRYTGSHIRTQNTRKYFQLWCTCYVYVLTNSFLESETSQQNWTELGTTLSLFNVKRSYDPNILQGRKMAKDKISTNTPWITPLWN